MSKTINPIIFKLGTKNQWNFKLIEKKNLESNNFSFIPIEIMRFFESILKKSRINLVSFKVYFKKSSINVFLTYVFSSFQQNQPKKINNKKISLNFLKLFLKGKLKMFDNRLKILKLLVLKKLKTKKVISSSLKFKTYFEKKLFYFNTLKKTIQNLKSFSKRLFFNKFYNFLLVKNKNINEQKQINSFVKKKIFTLQNFFKSKIKNLNLTFKQIDKNTLKNVTFNAKKSLSFKILNLKKFEKLSYFNSWINLIYKFSVKNDNFAYLFSNYVADEITKIRTTRLFNHFINFLKTIIKELMFRIKTSIKGIEIKISGNLRRKPRALSKTFNFGNKISKIKLNNNLDYFNSTCFSKKGTLGIKVWLTKT